METINPIDMPDFDYDNLTGEEFADYQSYVTSLRPTNLDPDRFFGPWDGPLFDFEIYEAVPVFEGQPGSQNLNGIQLISPEPISRSRVHARVAELFNAQIKNIRGQDNTGIYYLLKKPV